MVKSFVIGRLLSSVDGSKLIFYWMLNHCQTSRVCCHSKGSCVGVGLEVNIMDTIDFVLYLKTSCWMNIILEMLVQYDTNIDLNLCI